jgi:hypothetical protein
MAELLAAGTVTRIATFLCINHWLVIASNRSASSEATLAGANSEKRLSKPGHG